MKIEVINEVESTTSYKSVFWIIFLELTKKKKNLILRSPVLGSRMVSQQECAELCEKLFFR